MMNPVTTTTKSYMRFLPWIIWGLGALLFFSEYSARVFPSVANVHLMQAFHASGLELGGLSAFFYYAYVGMQLPVGVLVDRYGSHRLLTITALICALSSVLFATATSLAMADVARFLLGFGASFAFIGTLKLASVWFSASRFGLLAGLTQALGMLGAAVGEAPVAVAINHFGWRKTSFILGLVFIALAILIGLIVRNHPPGYVVDKPRAKTVSSVWNGLSIVLCNRQTWLNGLYVGFLYAPSAAFAELWGVRFLQRVHHISHVTAAFAIGLIFIGWTVGGPISGWFSDKIQRRKPIMIVSAVCGFLLLSLIIYVPQLPIPLIFILLFCYGLTNTGVVISYALASEINPRRIAGTSMAFANMSSVIIGAALQPILGWVLDELATGKKVHGLYIYSASDFRSAMSLLPVSMIVSVVFVFFIKETYCKNT
ncbi:MAG: MFS transporter [Gammaproteobacteria bacterium]|nr:MFS transporter [Gammaproteobacteria bacterium]